MSAVDMKSYLKRAVWHKKWPWSGFMIVAYVALAFVVPYLRLPPVVSGAFVAPMYYLLPTGVGLLLFGFHAQRGSLFLGRAQLLALSFFCGLFVITGLFVVRERYGILGSDPSVLFAVCVLAAMGGFLRQHRIFRPDRSLWRFVKLYFLLAFPLFLFRYLIHYGVFSDFPLTDMTQAGHLMKGALEFARFDVLNPFNADSYLPVQQAVNGLLVRYLGLDLLVAEWLYPFMSETLRFTVIYSVVSVLTTTAWSRNLALATAMVFMGGINSTNGELAALGSLLLLSIYAGKSMTGQSGKWFALSMMIILLGLGIARFLVQLDAWVYMSSVFVLILYTVMARNRSTAAMQVGAALLLVFCLVSMHRSTVMFVPVMVCVAAIYALLGNLHSRRHSPGAVISLQAAYVTLPVVVFGVATFVLVSALNGEDENFGLLPFYDRIMHILLGTTIYTPDVMMGSGSKIALFEFGHAMSPLLMLVTFGLFAFVLALPRFGTLMSRGGRGDPPWAANIDERLSPSILIPWCVTWLLALFVLGGFPFAHRLNFMPAVLLSVVFAELYTARMKTHLQNVSWPLILGMILLAVYIVAYACFMGLQTDAAQDSSDYIRRIQPVAIASAAMLLLGVTAIVILTIRNRSLAIGFAVVVVVVAAVAWEKQVSSAFYMRYAYGAVIPDDADAISHYTRRELAVADSLKQEPADTVLVSDPFLMSLLRARTGLNSVVTYSNFDTMSPSSRGALQGILRDLVNNVTERGIAGYCNVLAGKLTAANSSEFLYWSWRRRNPEDPRESFLRNRGYSNSLLPHAPRSLEPPAIPITSLDSAATPQTVEGFGVNFVVVLTKKTLDWANAPAQKLIGYYPSYETLDHGLVANLEKRFNAKNIDNQIVLFRLNCQAEMHSSTSGIVHGQ